MDTLPSLHKDSLIVISSRTAAKQEMAALSAKFALRGSVTVLDGGNCFPFYGFARLLRTNTLEGSLAARRLYIRRAFTCYQMLELLSSTMAPDQPCLVLNLLATFYDEQIPEQEVRRLLDACLLQVNRLRLAAPVIISVTSSHSSDRSFLVDQVCQCADRFFMLDELVPNTIQPVLF